MTNEGMRDASWGDDAHAFRRIHSKVLGALIRRLGSARFDIAEDAVQDAIVSALEKWRYSSMPNDPAASGTACMPQPSDLG